MDPRRRTVGALYFLAAFVLGLIVGYAFISRKPKKPYLALAEYWVFLPGETMPDQNALMDRTIGRNPYGRGPRLPIGTSEGILFSDVRFHAALVLRSRNPHAFRPDLFDASTEVDKSSLEALAEAKSFVKVRYASEDRLADARHLQFLPHVVDAVAELGDGKVIYDVQAERLLSREKLIEILKGQNDVSGPDVHARVVWKPELDAGHAETRGLVKMGHPELRTPASSSDQRVLITALLEEATRRIWLVSEMPTSLEIDAFDDRFRLLFEPSKDQFLQVRMMRIQTT